MNVVNDRLTECLFMVLACAALSGCGGAYDASVKGFVMLDGSPVAAGSVAFIPSDGGPLGYARSDDAGQYEVYTGNEAGLPSGQYGVTVVARESPKETHSKLGGPPAPGKRITPVRYGSSRSSPLEYTVEPGRNKITLELTSKPSD